MIGTARLRDVIAGSRFGQSGCGTFEVKLKPQVADDKAADATLVFHGDLEATSKGEMLTAGTGVYVTCQEACRDRAPAVSL